MNKLNFNIKNSKKIVLCLGFFDCIHIGHRKIIRRAKEIAAEHNSETAVFTFNNNPFEYLDKKARLIYNFDERCEILYNLKVDNVLSVRFDDGLMHMPHDVFFNKLFENFNICALICGKDYKSGNRGLGNVNFIAEFCRKHNVVFETMDDVNVSEQCEIKVSSTYIRTLLNDGLINEANVMLGDPYFIIETVQKGRQEGRKIDIPTINFNVNPDMDNLRDGVYAVKVYFDGNEYAGVSNAGTKPTYNIAAKSIETHIIGFEGDLYGKTIKVEFLHRLRNVTAFSTVAELKGQINKDILSALDSIKS